jgi:radical SAM superfamily enzyme YgiQ (UPF0313 family)
MRLTIVNCGDPDEYAVVKYQPLAPPYIAAYTPPSWQVEVVDENWEPFDPGACDADLVAFSALPRHVDRAYRHAAALKRRGVSTVGGGMHVSAIPEEALQHFDAIVEGEAEPIWPTVLADFEAGRLQRHYESHFDAPLHDLKLPDRSVIHPGYKIASLSTSRACENRCTFCYMGSYRNKAYRVVPTERILEDLEQLPQKTIVFSDANFLGFTQEHVATRIELCEGIIRRGIRKYWAAQITADVANHPELLRLLYRAGCRMAFIGFETIGNASLKSIDKDQYAPLDFAEVVQRVQAHGITVAASLILGLDTHTPDYEQELRDWLDRANPLFINIGVLTPMPNTALYKRARDEGQLLMDGIELWRNMDKATHTLRYKGMSAAQASEVFDNVVAHHFRTRKVVGNFARLFFLQREFALACLYFGAALRKRSRSTSTVSP